MMRSKMVFKNTFYAILLQIIIAVFGFITPSLLIKNYGSEINGLVSSINQILRYFSLLEAGLSGAAVYELYRFLKKKDFPEINKIVTYASKYYLKIGYIIMAGVLVIAPIYSLFIVKTSLESSIVFFLFLILGFSGAMEFIIMSRCRIIFTADQKGYIISIAVIISTLVYQLTTILMIINQVPILFVYLSSSLINIARGLILNYLVKKIYNNKINFKSNDDGFVIKTQKYVFIHEIFYTVNTSIPLIMINFYYTLNVASIYVVYNMPIIMINSILATMYQAITASYGNLVVEGNVDKENEVFNSFQFLYLGISTWLLATTAFLLTPFVMMYTRDISTLDYNMPYMGFMLIFFAVANCIRVIYAVPNSSHGLFKETYKASIVTTIVSVLLSAVFGRIDASLVLFGPIIAFILNGLYQMQYQRLNIKGLKTQTALKSIVSLLVIVSIASYLSLKVNFVPISFLSFVIYGAISFTIIGVLVVFIFSVTERKYLKGHTLYIKRLLSR